MASPYCPLFRLNATHGAWGRMTTLKRYIKNRRVFKADASYHRVVAIERSGHAAETACGARVEIESAEAVKFHNEVFGGGASPALCKRCEATN